MGLEGRQLFRRFGYRRLGLMLKRQDIKLLTVRKRGDRKPAPMADPVGS